MTLIQEQKFKRKDFKKTRDLVPVSLNQNERAILEIAKESLQQSKDSTAIKQLMKIGIIVIHDKKINKILDIVMNNKRKNKRLGVPDFD